MKKQILILGFLGLVGCKTNDEVKVPEGLVPPQKLTSILADIHIAEAQLETMQLNPDTAKVVFEGMQKKILQQRGVSQKDFDKTYEYYLNKNLIALDKIYEALVDTLSIREVKYGGQTDANLKHNPKVTPGLIE